MADNKKFHKHDHKHERQPRNEQIELEEEDKWNPTPEAFEAFQARDYELALRNVEMIMRSRNTSVTLKELKDSTLHSAGTVERVVDANLAAGFIVENKGRYSLASQARP